MKTLLTVLCLTLTTLSAKADWVTSPESVASKFIHPGMKKCLSEVFQAAEKYEVYAQQVSHPERKGNSLITTISYIAILQGDMVVGGFDLEIIESIQPNPFFPEAISVYFNSCRLNKKWGDFN